MRSLSWADLPDTLRDRIEADRDSLCPELGLIFRAFEETDLNNVKVVILGQDPYHTPGKARGVAFGYHPDYTGKTDSSLLNIISEVDRDMGYGYGGDFSDFDRTLESWTSQGVLLLNTRLTVLAGTPMTHARIGWEKIVTKFLQDLDKHTPDKVYMLWGREAQSYGKYLDTKNNLILETSHPCRFSAHKGFIGCGNFTEANRYLRSKKRGEITW